MWHQGDRSSAESIVGMPASRALCAKFMASIGVGCCCNVYKSSYVLPKFRLVNDANDFPSGLRRSVAVRRIIVIVVAVI